MTHGLSSMIPFYGYDTRMQLGDLLDAVDDFTGVSQYGIPSSPWSRRVPQSQWPQVPGSLGQGYPVPTEIFPELHPTAPGHAAPSDHPPGPTVPGPMDLFTRMFYFMFGGGMPGSQSHPGATSLFTLPSVNYNNNITLAHGIQGLLQGQNQIRDLLGLDALGLQPGVNQIAQQNPFDVTLPPTSGTGTDPGTPGTETGIPDGSTSTDTTSPTTPAGPVNISTLSLANASSPGQYVGDVIRHMTYKLEGEIPTGPADENREYLTQERLTQLIEQSGDDPLYQSFLTLLKNNFDTVSQIFQVKGLATPGIGLGTDLRILEDDLIPQMMESLSRATDYATGVGQDLTQAMVQEALVLGMTQGVASAKRRVDAQDVDPESIRTSASHTSEFAQMLPITLLAIIEKLDEQEKKLTDTLSTRKLQEILDELEIDPDVQQYFMHPVLLGGAMEEVGFASEDIAKILMMSTNSDELPDSLLAKYGQGPGNYTLEEALQLTWDDVEVSAIKALFNEFKGYSPETRDEEVHFDGADMWVNTFLFEKPSDRGAAIEAILTGEAGTIDGVTVPVDLPKPEEVEVRWRDFEGLLESTGKDNFTASDFKELAKETEDGNMKLILMSLSNLVQEAGLGRGGWRGLWDSAPFTSISMDELSEHLEGGSRVQLIDINREFVEKIDADPDDLFNSTERMRGSDFSIWEFKAAALKRFDTDDDIQNGIYSKEHIEEMADSYGRKDDRKVLAGLLRLMEAYGIDEITDVQWMAMAALKGKSVEIAESSYRTYFHVGTDDTEEEV